MSLIQKILNLKTNLNATSTGKATAICSLKFRIVFVSPFFELEVDAGNGWHTVHSQEGVEVGNDKTIMYQILRFKSFDDAFLYATDSLGFSVHYMKPKSLFGLYMLPPASYEKETLPRLMHPQYIVDGKSIPPSQVQEPAHKIASFTVFPGGEAQEKVAA